MSSKYATEVDSVQRVGDVTFKEVKQYTFDVSVSAIDEVSNFGDAEFIVRLNGRPIKRMNEYQARRLGLIL